MDTKAPIAFLPGVGASGDFWKPAARAMRRECKHIFHSWPGLGDEPPSPSVAGPSDLVDLVASGIHEPTDLIAQSMGGVIAMRLAVQNPGFVRKLVLATTSGGLPMEEHGALDWRVAYRQEYPDAPQWLYSDWGDQTEHLAKIDIPVLLIWGDSDPISPVSVGATLERLLPRSELRLIKGGSHDLAISHASEVATLIDDFLSKDIG